MDFLSGPQASSIIIILMMAGLCVAISVGPFVRKLFGLALFLASVFLFGMLVGRANDRAALIPAGAGGAIHAQPEAPLAAEPSLHATPGGAPMNVLKDALARHEGAAGGAPGEGLHATPHGETLPLLEGAPKPPSFDVAAPGAVNGGDAVGDATSRPPLHVLILGVLAVGAAIAGGLALAARRRGALKPEGGREGTQDARDRA